MKFSTASALFFAASIAIAIAAPPRYYNDEDYSEERTFVAPREPYTLARAPFYYQARTLELEYPARQRKYQIVKKKKNPNAPASDEDEPEDDEEDGSSEEEEEEDEEEDDLETPPWEQLFPEEDKNTGTFDDQGGSGIGGGPNADLNLPGGAPAPSSGGGSLMNLFSSGSSEGSQNDYSGAPQYREQGPPPPPPPQEPYRARSDINEEEPRSGGAVIYDGHRYIPVKPVQVRIPQRQSKKVKVSKKQQEVAQSRSLRVSPSSSRPSKSSRGQPRFVLVPVPRENREIRFSKDDESGPHFQPAEIWRWEGAAGRPLRRRENRPSGIIYAPGAERTSSHRSPLFIRY